MIRKFLFFISLFAFAILTYGQKPDYIEYYTIYGYRYDIEKGKEYSTKKRELLTNSLSFYDKQIQIVENWITTSKCKIAKKVDDQAILFNKMFVLDYYEENLPEEVSVLLNNKELCSQARNKRKTDKSFVPLFISLKNRLSKEKEQISSIINEEDSIVLKYPATSRKNIGLLYINKEEPLWYDNSSIKYNWALELDEKILNTIPTSYGEIQEKNPDYNPIAGQWAWVFTSDYENVRTTYPVEETYKKYKNHPEYKVKTIDKRNVVYLNDSVVFIEKEKDKKTELIRQVCIADYRNNKYNIHNSSSSLLAIIDEILIDGKDRYYYAGCEMTYNMAKKAFNKMMQIKNSRSLGGTFLNSMANVPEPTEEEIAQFETKLAILEKDIQKAKLFDSDPEYKTAENYIKQLESDRSSIEFKTKRVDGVSYVYTSTGGNFAIKMTMNVEGKSIKEIYTLNNL